MVLNINFGVASPLWPEEFIDGEKLVDGMLRRIRVAAAQAGQDPDELHGQMRQDWVAPFDVGAQSLLAKKHGSIKWHLIT